MKAPLMPYIAVIKTMNNHSEKPKIKSQQRINLPHINHSKSLPVVQHPKK